MPRPEPEEIRPPDWSAYRGTKVKADVLAHLLADGWQVKKQTFYNHCTAGKLMVNRGGVYTKGAVKKYAEKNLIHSSVGVSADQAAINLAAQKTQKEIRRIDIATKRDEFKFEVERKLYVLKSDVAAELAARAVVLDNGLEYMFQSSLAEMIALVQGDQSRATDLLEYLLEKKDRQMNEFASMGDFLVELEIEGVGGGFGDDGEDEFDEFGG